MIEARQLSKTFGSQVVVDKLSFTVQTGQTLALLGSSGSGKTTTLRMINRLIEPSSGEINVNGKAVLSGPPEVLRRSMGYVIQSIGLFPHYTVEENIGVVPNLLGWNASGIRKRAVSLLQQLSLAPEEYLHKYPGQLSGGQQQRVGIARALAADPPIVLMDEPFGALDPITRSEIRADFKEMEDLRSKTIILVTHDVEEAFEMADLICLLDMGRIQQLGPARELLFEPANAFVENFLEGQRMQLELNTIVLSDLLDLLPQIAPGPVQNALDLSPELTIRKAIKRLSKENMPGEIVVDGSKKQFTLSQLNSSYYQFLAG